MDFHHVRFMTQKGGQSRAGYRCPFIRDTRVRTIFEDDSTPKLGKFGSVGAKWRDGITFDRRLGLVLAFLVKTSRNSTLTLISNGKDEENLGNPSNPSYTRLGS